MQFQFSKWHGAGNDFVIVDGFTNRIDDYRETAIAACDRHFGIGADGLVVILPSEKADFQMRIFNSDGSEAEMCGNVTRCVARYVYEHNMTDKTQIAIETKAGLIVPRLCLENEKVSFVRVDMGAPALEAADIPVAGFERRQVVGAPLQVMGKSFAMTCVSMGNPHCVIFVDDVDRIDLAKYGAAIETKAIFPKKINVEFAQVIDREHIRMRVWERGAGITMACGTGACATLVAAALNGKTDRRAALALDGGNLLIEWADDGHVFMSGPAEEVFYGRYVK